MRQKGVQKYCSFKEMATSRPSYSEMGLLLTFSGLFYWIFCKPVTKRQLAFHNQKKDNMLFSLLPLFLTSFYNELAEQ